MKWIRSYFKLQELEDQLFLAALLIAVPYFVSSITFDLLSSDGYLFLIIGSSFLAIVLTMIVLLRKQQWRKMLINIFSILVIGGFSFYWISSGGIDGGGPYIFPAVSVLVILISRGWHSVVVSILLVLTAIFITSDLVSVNGETAYSGLLFDFILNLFILSAILIFFKKSLDKEREELRERNHSIQKLNDELSIKSTELELYNRDIELIGKNLEKVAARHYDSMEKENKKIIEYSFINAHLVRAPLVNIIGLTSLIEEKNEQAESLEKTAQKFDGILHKISSVLNH